MDEVEGSSKLGGFLHKDRRGEARSGLVTAWSRPAVYEECREGDCSRPVYEEGRCKRHHDELWWQQGHRRLEPAPAPSSPGRWLDDPLVAAELRRVLAAQRHRSVSGYADGASFQGCVERPGDLVPGLLRLSGRGGSGDEGSAEVPCRDT